MVIILRSVHIGKKKYSLTNTCAFDSILQLFIAAYFDTENIKDFISTEIDFIFFELIKEVVTYGIKKSSYRLRVEILRQIFSGNISSNNCILIDCQVTVGFLCRKLFTQYPTFRETSRCSNCCTERLKVLPLDFAELEKDIIILLQRCNQANCDGFEITSISYTDEGLLDVKLDDIPKKLKFSFMEKEHSLVGIVNYKSPVNTRHTSEEIGHYIALCYRKNKKWVQYDECKDSEIVLNDKYVACPHLILYSI
ncbi:hypothetical protein ACFW04_013521 [Cataglyphis niger]